MRQRLVKQWQFKNPDINKSLALAAELGISLLGAQLLVNRGLKTAAEAHTYLYPQFADLHCPFKLAGMEKSVARVQQAIQRGEKIYIYGDYDTDGTTATALLLNTFREMDVPAAYYIPNRFTEGYGLSKETVEKIHEKGAKLLITVDCGIKSVEEVKLANALGIDVIITDHHQPDPEVQPPAHALISPKVSGNEYPYPELAGVGLAFKLAHGLIGDTPFLRSLLDLVALGTVVDIAPLTGENRVLSRLGLDALNKRGRPGIAALCEVSGFGAEKPLLGQSLSFGLGPRINAAGRIHTADKVVKLLTTESKDVAKRYASELNYENRERQKLEASIRDEAQAIINRETDESTKGIVVASDRWPEKAQGVVGIVASRLLEIHHKPVFVLVIRGEEATGSGRCIDGMNLADSLNSCTHLLVKHGGHAAAAGLTLKTRNIRKFKEAFNAYACANLSDEALQPKLELDFETSLSVLTLKTLRELEKFEPFGSQNPEPRFKAHRVKISGSPTLVGKERQHLRMFISNGTTKLCAIAWRKGEHLITFKRPNTSLDIAFSPQINEWNNTLSIQLTLQDWQIYPDSRGVERGVFPASRDASVAKVVDGRRENKKAYLLKLLERDESCIIYVQNPEMLELLLTRLIPERADGIARHDAATSAVQESALLEKLGRGELRAIASSATFSELEGFPFVKNFVFCHLTPSSDEFFKRCKPAFTSDRTSELHLLYRDADSDLMKAWISQKYPDAAALRTLYRNLRNAIASNGAEGLPKVEVLNGALGAPATVKTVLTIFEELQLIARHSAPGGTRIKLLPAKQRGLERSKTYLKGQWLKQTSQACVAFQLQKDIEQIWERIADECRSVD